MLYCALGFLIGACLLGCQSYLPKLYFAYYAISGAFLLLLFYVYQCFSQQRMANYLSIGLKVVIAILLGWSWAFFHASWQLSKTLPYSLEGKPLFVCGTIISIPEIHENSIQFNFLIKKRVSETQNTDVGYKVRLSWYGKHLPVLHIGEHWQLHIQLKRPHSIINPGGRDYERWLFEQGINAQGYVKPNVNNQYLRRRSYYPFESIRERLNAGIQQSLWDRPGKGLIAALVVGRREQITAKQWLTMQDTGTNHLMAIAGLHIGFVGGFIYFLTRWLWCRSARLMLAIPAPQAAAIMMLIAAFCYSALAGFALPTQRAVMMLAVFLLSTLLKRHLPLWHAWSLALFIMLVINPLAILSDSFWLSFGSVAIILYGSTHRLRPSGIWWKYFHIQWTMALGLIPLTLWFFQTVSFTSFIANAIAIPWVGFVVLPLSLLGAVSYGIFQPLAVKAWQWAESLLLLMWQILEWLAGLTTIQWQVFIPSYTVLLLAVVGFLLLIAPRGLPGRWLGFVWMLPLLKANIASPANNELWLTVLDVGQGLAITIRTANHTLVYDTGPSYSLDYDMGKAAVIPYLRAMGVIKLDALVISHADNDHSGGANSILKAIQVERLFTSYVQQMKVNNNFLCQEGIVWKWDGVLFEFLNPIIFKQKNNNSCVLRITVGNNSILLPGDIEKKGEDYLLAHHPYKLKATVIVAPHHGSHTSSTVGFVNAVNPKYVLFSVGYHNRFHLPKMAVVARYQQAGAIIYRTDYSGAITIKFQRDSMVPLIEEYRRLGRHFWNAS